VQTSLITAAHFSGVALHSGRDVAVSVLPAAANTGIVFERIDLDGPAATRLVPVCADALVEANLCTRLQNAAGTAVATIEHLMAALAGCGIHNARILIDGPEVPILDGSARPFVAAFIAAGVERLNMPLHALRVLRSIEVREGAAWARLEPAPVLEIAFEIDFPDAAIGRQTKSLVLRNGTFVRELSDSRTFCRQADVDFMRANGLALGGSYENAVVVQGDAVLSPGGLRHADEPVRHKMLDALGDLAVAGAPILGRYIGHRAGHTLTGRLVRALLADPSAFERIQITDSQARDLPGAGICAADLQPAA
jgi:UDP-3-O-[3-hydroxymyristoyl] N-acetylglucosamine deacetylase